MARAKVEGVDSKRCRELNQVEVTGKGPVVYWMSRDQRCEDNWALLYAQGLARLHASPLHVVFCLVPRFLDATIRQYDFLLRGLREVETGLREFGIPFHLRLGMAVDEVPKLCSELGATAVVCDMSPLRVPRAWSGDVARACGAQGISVTQVDAHNVVPVWAASDKQEYAARTIRKKIMNSLHCYLTDFPALQKQEAPSEWPAAVDWAAAEKSLEVDRTVDPVEGIIPGSAAARARLDDFCQHRLTLFAEKRNDPNVDALSGLSPYLHFGQISAQRCALRVKKYGDAEFRTASVEKGCEAFIEEAVVRRELADNFCFYNDKYDSIEGAAEWAQKTLKDHEADQREYLYSAEDMEAGKTHDDLWNAAQLQMVREGKMHGFLRMYWAKKILEWSPSPRQALELSIKLNDKYELDGRDPNGYVGCMWSICGIHDQGWAERKVFGKIRFMNYAGCKRKLNIAAFVSRYPSAAAAEASKDTRDPKASRKK